VGLSPLDLLARNLKRPANVRTNVGPNPLEEKSDAERGIQKVVDFLFDVVDIFDLLSLF
jgi:hypothetical protein